MHYIQSFLTTLSCGYIIDDIIRNDITKDPTHIYAHKDRLSIVVIAPHSGNNFMFLLRANPTETLDRWSECDFEKRFLTEIDLTEYLKSDKMYLDLFETYLDKYLELIGEDE